MRFLFSILICALVLSPAAWAETTISDDFLTIESTGLLPSQKDGALGDGVWSGSERANIAALIRGMPISSQSKVVQNLIHAVLLGQGDTGDLHDAKDVKPGEDLLTLRLAKLLQAGLYKPALDLWSAAGDGTHHPATTKAGILAMIGSGQKSLACVEAKIFDNQEIAPAFWTDLRAYCDYTLSEEPSEQMEAVLKASPYDVLRKIAFDADYRFAYDSKQFGALSKLEQTVLIAGQRLEAPALSTKDIAAIPPQHLSALLAMTSIQGDVKLRLYIRAAALGVIDARDLVLAYKTLDTLPLPALFVALGKADNVPALALQALEFGHDYGAAALVPFIPFLLEIETQNLSLKDLKLILQIFYQGDEPMPAQFLHYFVENTDQFSGDSDYFRISAAFYLHASGTKRRELSKIVQENMLLEKSPHFFTINVIENLDKGSSNVDNALKAYEKDFILTSKTQHAMPSRQLWNRLKTVSQSKILGETALLSIYVLSGQTVTDFYPGLLDDVLRSFRTVGLTNTSNKLALESLIGNQ